MQGPAILHRHLKDDAVETYVTGDASTPAGLTTSYRPNAGGALDWQAARHGGSSSSP